MKKNVEKEKSETHFGFQSIPEDEKEEKVKEVFSNVATTYDLMNDVMSGGLHRVWKDVFIERLSPAPGTKLLDVAGGTGDVSQRFVKVLGYGKEKSESLVEDFDLPRDITSQVYMDPDETSTSSSETTQSSPPNNAPQPTPLEDGTPYTFRYLQNPDANGSHVTVCDINKEMLAVGKDKLVKQGLTSGISWVQGNAEKLPFPDEQFDAYTIAFGIRNCTHVQEVLDEAYRVLKPGGRFLCLEFSEVPNYLLRNVYDAYSFQVIPVLGQVIAKDWNSYQYLVESIRKFPNQEAFADMIKAAGFRMVKYENLTFGVVAIHSGFKI